MIPVAWLQLKKDRLRLLVAVAGVGFAVMLVFMQLGFRAALFKSAVQIHSRLVYDLAMISVKTPSFIYSKPFSRRRLVQVRGLAGVASTSALLTDVANWRNPANRREQRQIHVIGFDPSVFTVDLPGVEAHRHQLTRPDVVLFDERSRPEFGPIPALLRQQGTVRVEVRDRAIDVIGLFALGTSFGIDGIVMTSDLNFHRLFPRAGKGDLHIGLIRLEEGADVEDVRRRALAMMPGDVALLTRQEFVDLEVDYWNNTTPIGFIFDLGALIGLIVGAIIVYQILFADVSEHMREYATLKAIGYGNGYLSGVVIQQGLILALIGFVPGSLIAVLLYRAAAGATNLPLEMTPLRALAVLGLTIAICTLSGSIALRKVRAADPAEVF